MARQAEAERERRAKIIHAEGEFPGGPEALRRGRRDQSANPATLQLRYLQTLPRSRENNSTIVFPLPIDLIKMFLPGTAPEK